MPRSGGKPGPSDQALDPRSKLVPYPQDEALIMAASTAAAAAITAGHPWRGFQQSRQIWDAAHRLRKLSDWLQEKQKGAIADRFNNDSSLLDQDIGTFRRDRKNSNYRYLGFKMLRRHLGELEDSDPELDPDSTTVPYPNDAELIEKAAKAALKKFKEKGPSKLRIKTKHAADHLKKFSGWLQAVHRDAIADRLNDPSLVKDTKKFHRTYHKYSLSFGLKMLREHVQDLDGLAPELEQQLDVEEPLHEDLQEFAVELERQLDVDEERPGESTKERLQRVFTQVFGDSPPSGSRQSSPSRGGSSPDISQAMPPQEHAAWAAMPEDFGHIVGLGWNHGPRAASDALIGALNRRGALPTASQPATNLVIHGHPYTAQIGPGMRESTPNNPLGRNITLIPRLQGG